MTKRLQHKIKLTLRSDTKYEILASFKMRNTILASVGPFQENVISSPLTVIVHLLGTQVRVRWMCGVQRAGFVTPFSVQNKRIPRTNVAFADRSVVEGSYTHCLRTVLGVKEAKQNRNRIQSGIQRMCSLQFGIVIISFKTINLQVDFWWNNVCVVEVEVENRVI